MDDQNTWRRAYCGSAQVAFAALKPRVGSQKSLDSEKILELYKVFSKEKKCRRLDEDTRLRAVISEEDFATYRSTFEQGGQSSLPRLRSRSPIVYIHGRSRIAAATVFLPPNEHWWGVDFYREKGELNTSSALL